MSVRHIVLGAFLGVAASGLSAAALTQTDAFASAMDAAMARMHRAMMTGYSGDHDRDFAAMMIAHHQGAIDMAGLELRFGKDERLRRLAQGIIVEQEQEIALMRNILRDRGQLRDQDSPSIHAQAQSGEKE